MTDEPEGRAPAPSKEDLEFLEALLAEAPLCAPPLASRVLGGLAGLALGVVCLGGALAFHTTLEETSRRGPGRSPRPRATRPRLARASLTSLPALVRLPLQPILDRGEPAPLASLPPREPAAGPPLLSGLEAARARRYAGVVRDRLREDFGVDDLGSLEVLEARRALDLPRWLHLRFVHRRLLRALEEAGLDPGALTLHADEGGAGELVLALRREAPPAEARGGSGQEPFFAWTFAKPRARARIALIVDDVGYGGPSTRRLLAFRTPLNVAILPFYFGSRKAAETALALGHDPMLHMPFQPKGAAGKYRQGVVVGRHLPPEEIQRRTRRALESLPGVVGLNNHMGSLGSESWYVCAEVLKVAREKDLFFVDSLTSSRSVAHAAARKLGVPTRKRNTAFLDHDPSPEGVTRSLRKLLAHAKDGKDRVAILHDKPDTVAALEAEIPRFRAAGVEFVFARDLVR